MNKSCRHAALAALLIGLCGVASAHEGHDTATGFAAGFAYPFDGSETGIAMPALLLGAMVAFAVQVRVGMAALLVGAFSVIHGYAHGAELPGAASPLAYGLGFVAATLLLHAAGVATGLMLRSSRGMTVVRVVDGLIAGAGTAMLPSIA